MAASDARHARGGDAKCQVRPKGEHLHRTVTLLVAMTFVHCVVWRPRREVVVELCRAVDRWAAARGEAVLTPWLENRGERFADCRRQASSEKPAQH